VSFQSVGFLFSKHALKMNVTVTARKMATPAAETEPTVVLLDTKAGCPAPECSSAVLKSLSWTTAVAEAVNGSQAAIGWLSLQLAPECTPTFAVSSRRSR